MADGAGNSLQASAPFSQQNSQGRPATNTLPSIGGQEALAATYTKYLERSPGVMKTNSMTRSKLGLYSDYKAGEAGAGRLIGSYGYTSPSYTVLSPSGPPRARWGSTGVSRESYKGRQSALTEKDMEYLREHDEQSNQVWETWRQRKTLELQLAKEEQHNQQERSVQAFQEREKEMEVVARAQYRAWKNSKADRMRQEKEQWKVKQIQLRAMQMYQKRLHKEYQDNSKQREIGFSVRAGVAVMPKSFDDFAASRTAAGTAETDIFALAGLKHPSRLPKLGEKSAADAAAAAVTTKDNGEVAMLPALRPERSLVLSQKKQQEKRYRTLEEFEAEKGSLSLSQQGSGVAPVTHGSAAAAGGPSAQSSGISIHAHPSLMQLSPEALVAQHMAHGPGREVHASTIAAAGDGGQSGLAGQEASGQEGPHEVLFPRSVELAYGVQHDFLAALLGAPQTPESAGGMSGGLEGTEPAGTGAHSVSSMQRPSNGSSTQQQQPEEHAGYGQQGSFQQGHGGAIFEGGILPPIRSPSRSASGHGGVALQGESSAAALGEAVPPHLPPLNLQGEAMHAANASRSSGGGAEASFAAPLEHPHLQQNGSCSSGGVNQDFSLVNMRAEFSVPSGIAGAYGGSAAVLSAHA